GRCLLHGGVDRLELGLVLGRHFGVLLGHFLFTLLEVIGRPLLRLVFRRRPATREYGHQYDDQCDHTDNHADNHAGVAALLRRTVTGFLLGSLHLAHGAATRCRTPARASARRAARCTGAASRARSAGSARACRFPFGPGRTDLNHAAALGALKLDAGLQAGAVVFHAASWTTDRAHESPRLTIGGLTSYERASGAEVRTSSQSRHPRFSRAAARGTARVSVGLHCVWRPAMDAVTAHD